MLQSSFDLFILRDVPWNRFDFPRWHALLSLALMGILMGFDPSLREMFPESAENSYFSLKMSMAYSLLTISTYTVTMVVFMKWFMKRGGRWNGEGDIFNLLAASWLVVSLVSTALKAFGMTPGLQVLLGLYSISVGGKALSAVIPKASLVYSASAILISGVLATIISVIPAAALHDALVASGVTSSLLR